jgi:uncharacterized protein YdhG (YjbR/CyaY superfamily)
MANEMSNAQYRKAAKIAEMRKDGERAVLDAISKMQWPDRKLAKRIHVIVKKSAPRLEPLTWYGFPAYAIGGKVVCFFQPAAKFKTRYATLGFQHKANLDDGNMWPTSFAVKKLAAAEDARIAALVKKAVRP